MVGFDHADVDDWWEVVSRSYEHISWDDWYVTEVVMGAEFYSEREGMPCPECGSPMTGFFGQIDQDYMGNDIHAAGFVCDACAFEDIEEIDE